MEYLGFDVSRLPTLLIALMLTLGPDVSLFCKTWCDPVEAASTGCHQPDQGASASVASDRDCDRNVSRIAPFIGEVGARALDTQDSLLAIPPSSEPLVRTTGRALNRRQFEPDCSRRPSCTLVPLRV
jgi:hypothetical protein